MKKLYVLGAGGHGAVVAEIATLIGFDVVGFIDDDPDLAGRRVLDWPVLGGREKLPDGSAVAFGIGDNSARASLLEELRARSLELPVLIHPSAAVSSSAEMGPGTVVVAQAVVNARARVGQGCILNTGCSVDHDCTIGNYAHIAPGVRLGGYVTVGEQTLVGIGSCVRPGISIGERCVIGAGSVVVSDFGPGSCAFGNPAKLKKIIASDASPQGSEPHRISGREES